MPMDVAKPQDPEAIVIEAWAQGYMIGSLIIMACVAFSNMRSRVLLHKLIVIELLLGTFHGTFIFTNPPVYNWYLSTTAILLNVSWSLHNVIAWMKNKPFLSRRGSMFYIGTVILVQPYWVLEITANFLYFSGQSNLFQKTRPYEALCRDPWWIFTACSLFYNIKSRYDFGYIELIRVSPRFGVLLAAMLTSIGFLIVDILAVTHAIPSSGLPDGINPFWKLAFVFRCLTDMIILDDFKTALDRLSAIKMERMGSVLSDGIRGDFTDVEQARRKKLEQLQVNPSGRPHDSVVRDYGKSQDSEHIDLEAALEMDRHDSGNHHNNQSEELDFITALNMEAPSDQSASRSSRGGLG
ncbi:hypothetical protein CB0940_09326 [Cercospora beticola]|uniref:Uncharacterized protein n=1 Tax=Cercospora beticola TaxID=122368 RepID=A0A2G5HHZ5_CERBT|nr:hypothetical protein CB0940_09326 [Cercospora beticola]PIA92160.1 hypothetical protein CB0940_09326 [Cercospora beticola]WPB06359.1 hypothetical protein RHO25_011016 [Cercospora beticola]CAK1366253.1 unnamed protein product [Cercospora beticola]